MKNKLAWLFIAALASSTATTSAATQDARADILATYSFEPAKMTFQEQAARAPLLSALWERASRSPETYLEPLRKELRASGNPELLYCDGGMLLLNKSQAAEDRALAMKSMEKCSLAEIQHTPYFFTLHALAVQGVDTFALQTKILGKPKYAVYIVQHALSLGQDYAFLYPLLVQEEAAYVPKLLARLKAEQDPVAQKSLVRALWYAATPDAEAAIRNFATSGPTSPAKDDARNMVQRLNTIRQWSKQDSTLKRILASVKVSENISEPELRAKRRQRMHAISDEALYDLESYTALIYWQRHAS